MSLKRAGVITLVVFSLFMSGCGLNTSSITETGIDEEIDQGGHHNLDNLMKSGSLIAVRQSSRLLLLNPETKEFSAVYELGENEIPLGNELFDFVVSKSGKWIVWYTANKGLLVLDVEAGESALVAEASDWVNRNPYFELDEDDLLYWIGDDGAILNKFDLETKEKQAIPIPYPFGNIFRVAPNKERFLYITGYSDNAQRPRFMFSDRQGNLQSTFASQVELSSRFNVVWTPDSRGVITLFDGQAWIYPYENPESPTPFVTLSHAEARDITRSGDEIFILDSQGYWHKYDYESRKELARIPTDIARELRRPQFHPWGEDMLLINEISQNEENRFQRLWLSNYRGQKTMVLAQFGEATVGDFSLQLD